MYEEYTVYTIAQKVWDAFSWEKRLKLSETCEEYGSFASLSEEEQKTFTLLVAHITKHILDHLEEHSSQEFKRTFLSPTCDITRHIDPNRESNL